MAYCKGRAKGRKSGRGEPRRAGKGRGRTWWNERETKWEMGDLILDIDTIK